MDPIDLGLPLEQRIVAAIRQIVRAVDLHSHRILDECGLTGPQLTTLAEVARSGSSTPTAIARAVHLSQGTVTGILQRLEKQHLVTRRRSEQDRRTVFIEATPAGHEILASAPSLLQDRFRAELSRLAEWERTQILATLQRVAGLMGADDLDAAPHLITDAVRLDQGAAAVIGEVAPLRGPGGVPGRTAGETAGGKTGRPAADESDSA
jgi:DNA-binding MarR family transcriptional regulator